MRTSRRSALRSATASPIGSSLPLYSSGALWSASSNALCEGFQSSFSLTEPTRLFFRSATAHLLLLRFELLLQAQRCLVDLLEDLLAVVLVLHLACEDLERAHRFVRDQSDDRERLVVVD